MNFVKKLLMIIGIILVLFIAAGLLLPVFIDVNDYKSKIEQLVEENIDRKLILEGDLELKTFPFLKVKTGRLTLANPKGFPRQNMLEVDSAEVGIRLLPLLLKKVEAGTIKFDSPVINLTKKSNGHANWDFSSGNKDSEESMTQTDSNSSSLAAIAVQGFEVSNAQVNFADLANDTVISIRDLNLNTGSIIPGTEFPVEVSAIISGSMTSDPIQTTLNSDLTIDRSLETLILNQFKTVINQSDLKYEISSPTIVFQIPDKHLSLKALELKDSTGEDTQAQMLIENINIDLNKLIANLDNANAQLDSAQINARLSLPKIEFNANDLSVLIADSVLMANNTELNAQFNMPETFINLTESAISLQNLTGNFSYNNLSGSLLIPKILVNKDTLEFKANAIESVIGKSKLITDVSAGLSPLTVNFDINTSNLNLKEILSSLGTEPDTANPSALTELTLNILGNYKQDNLNIDQLTGKLDQTTINGNASITDFKTPAYQLNLAIGDLAIDDYLPQPSPDNTGSANDTATAAVATPVALSQFNITAAIEANRIYSKNSQIALENLSLGISPENKTSSIIFDSLISGAALPETITLSIETLAQINSEKRNVELSALQMSAKGKTITTRLDVPLLVAPFSFDRINIEDIKANFSNQIASSQLNIPDLSYNTDKSSLVIKNITGKGSFNKIDANIILPNLSIALDNQRLKLNELALDLRGDKPVGRLSVPTLDINLANKSLGPTNIIFEGQDGRAQINLKPTDESGNYYGNLLANDFNLRGILNRFNILTDLEDKSALTRINIQSPISFNESKIKLENIKASIDETNISGFAQAQMGLKPVYDFSIKIGNLNADRYIPAASEKQSSQSTKAVAAPVAIPIELFRNTTATGEIGFDQLQIGGAQFSNLNIGVKSKQGKLSISPIESNFFNGKMDGDLAIDSAGNVPQLDFNYALSNVALEPALSSLGVTKRLSGNGNFNLKMAASGKTDKAMTSSVTGASSLEISNGAIKGINLQDILFEGYQAYAALKNKTVKSKYNPADQTEFSSMTGSWSIRNGVIYGNDLQIQAPLFRMDGEGQISLINNSIDYLLNVKVVKSLEGQGGKSMKELEGRTIPLSITGSLADPQYQLDISTLIKAEAQKKAEEKIQEKIEDELGEKLEGEGTLQEKLQKKAVEKASEKLLDLFNKF